MSRHTTTSKHRSSRDRGLSSEELVEQIKNIATQLNEVVSSDSQNWETYLESARSAVAALDHLNFFRDPQRHAEQVWILSSLQDYAFHDADTGCIEDIADFTQMSWLKILRNHPEDVGILMGLGQNWLQRAQETLVKIQCEETDFSSQGSNDAAHASDQKRESPIHIEARGYLQPAVDFHDRAVRSANALGIMTGGVLSSAAEAQISMGSVTDSPNDEWHFTQAVRYLRQAQEIPDYILPSELQQYLNEYGRYVL